MTRWLGVVGAGLLAALVALLVLRPGAPIDDAQRAAALAAQLRCPDCQGLSVADSHSASAREIRRQLDEMVAGGATDDQIIGHFVARYGDWIRLEPASALPWVVPYAVAALAVALLAAWLLRRAPPSTAGDPAPPAPLPEAERRRLHEEADAIDA